MLKILVLRTEIFGTKIFVTGPFLHSTVGVTERVRVSRKAPSVFCALSPSRSSGIEVATVFPAVSHAVLQH